MIAILGGLGAALAWATTTMCASLASRKIGSKSTLALVMLVGLLAIGPVAAAEGVPDALGGRQLVWLGVAGFGNVSGLLLVYAALKTGKIGIVAAIVSAEGAVAALIAVGAGEHLRLGVGVALAVIVAGVVITTRAEGPAGQATPEDPRSALLAVAAAAFFGVGLYATGRASADLPLAWAVLPPRVVGVTLVTIPLVVSGRLRVTRPVLAPVVIGGLAEVAGFLSYAVASRHGIAISAVLASQFAALAAVAAWLLFHERLGRIAIAGIGAIVAGVAVLSALQASG